MLRLKGKGQHDMFMELQVYFHGWSVEIKCEITRSVTKDRSQIRKGVGSHTRVFRHEEPLKSCKP